MTQESNLQGQGTEETRTPAAQDEQVEPKAAEETAPTPEAAEAKVTEPVAAEASPAVPVDPVAPAAPEAPAPEAPAPEAATPEAATPEAPAAEATPAPEEEKEESAYKTGQRIWGKILRLTDTQATIALGENECDEGVLDLIHLRDEFGNLSISEGDEVQAYVIGTGATLKLAPSLYPPAAEVMKKLTAAKENDEVVRGRVTGVNKGGLDINVEGRRAFCPFSQIQIGRCEEPEVHINHILEFKVTELEEEKKRIVLSRRAILEGARMVKMKELRNQIKDGTEFDGIVMRLQPFGAFVDIGGIGGIEGLVHVSEISHDRLDHPGEALKRGEKVRVKVLDVSPGKGGKDRIRLSMKALLADPWSTVASQFNEGDIITGLVMRVTDFGTFVKINPGIEGLLHVSQYKSRDDHRSAPAPAAEGAAATEGVPAETAPAETAPAVDPSLPIVGTELTIKISKIEPQRRRISLVLRDEDRPARSGRKLDHDGSIGDVVEGVVRTIKPYGVFLDLPSLGNWVSGLLPGQESGFDRDVNLKKKFPEGEKVKVEIIDIDDQGRIRLSRRSLIEGGSDNSGDSGGGYQGGRGRGRGGSGGGGGRQQLPTAPPSAGFNMLADALRRAQERNKDK